MVCITPIQVAATIALDGDQTCVDEIRATYDKRMHILLEAFENAGWKLQKPRASMFVWAKLPESKRHLKSLEFFKATFTACQCCSKSWGRFWRSR